MSDEELSDYELLVTQAELGRGFEHALTYGEGIRARLAGLGYSPEDAASIAACQIRIALRGVEAALVEAAK